MTRFPRLHLLALAALIGALVIATADAQPPGGGRRPGAIMGGRGGPGMMGGGLLGLLGMQEVREELKVTEAQQDKLRELGEKLREEMRGIFPDREATQDLTPEQRRERMQEAMEKFRKEAEKRAPEVEKQIAEILDKAQFKRIKQLEVQRQGVDALLRADIIQALGLTQDQQGKIKEAIEERNKKQEELGEQMRGMFQGGFRDMSEEQRADARKKMEQLGEKRREIQTEAQKKAMGFLTDDQKAMMPNLMGEPFEFPRFDRRRGPGQGRGGEGQQGEGQRGGDRPRRPRGQR
jgi:Spy/CpxP family protein refolding chaperone